MAYGVRSVALVGGEPVMFHLAANGPIDYLSETSAEWSAAVFLAIQQLDQGTFTGPGARASARPAEHRATNRSLLSTVFHRALTLK